MEFLINRTDGEWFDLPSSRFKDVLRPSLMPSKPIEGWGDHRILIEDSEVSFSDEDPGIQVVFETRTLSAEAARRVVNEIAANITAATGQQSRVISI